MNALSTSTAPRTTIHRDGTVTLWDCVSHTWRRRVPARAIAHQVLASLPQSDRDRVIAAAKYGI